MNREKYTFSDFLFPCDFVPSIQRHYYNNQQEVVKQNCISNPFDLVYAYSAATFAHSASVQNDFAQSSDQICSNKTGMCREQAKELEGVSNQWEPFIALNLSYFVAQQQHDDASLGIKPTS